MAPMIATWVDQREAYASRVAAYFPEVQSARYPSNVPRLPIQPRSHFIGPTWIAFAEGSEAQTIVLTSGVCRAEPYQAPHWPGSLIAEHIATDTWHKAVRLSVKLQSHNDLERALRVFARGTYWNNTASEELTSNDHLLRSTCTQTDHWFRDPESILARLENPTDFPGEFSQAILFAETTAFTDHQRPRLRSALHEFITQHRFAQDNQSITHVAAAIRKYAMNMCSSDFEDYAQWFQHSDTATLACDVELELAKGVVSRVLYGPFAPETAAPLLGERLVGLASDYLKPRLILQQSYEVVVLHAILGAILLKAPGTEELIEGIRGLNLPWFEKLFFRRVEREAKRLPADRAELKRRLTQWLPGRE